MESDAGGQYERRLALIRSELIHRGLAGALLYGTCRREVDRIDPLEYVSAFRLAGQHGLAMVPLEAEPSMIVTPAADYERAMRESWIQAITAVDDILAGGRKLRPRGTMGVCGIRLMTPEFAAGLRRFLATAWVECDDLLETLPR
ncbi:MAG: hypothetical protein ACYDAG_08645 [Chloroflexota bacterium]